jgi:hypothetical protein
VKVKKYIIYPLLAILLCSNTTPLFADDEDNIDVKTSVRETRMKKNWSFLRFGFSRGRFLHFYDDKLENYTKKDISLFIDVVPYNIAKWDNFKLNAYGRYTFTHLSADKKAFYDNNEFLFFYPDIYIHQFNLGVRFIYEIYMFGFMWEGYVMAAPRYVLYHEKGKDDLGNEVDSQNLHSIGFIGGIGFEVALHELVGVFVEYNNGYTPIGDSDSNIQGHQFFCGVSARL